MLDRLFGFITSLQIEPRAIVDVGLTALLIYGLFSLIRGTRAVRLVIGVTVLYGIYLAAQFFGLDLLSQILQTGAVVGLLALVVVFQPELRRALERIGRIGSLSWLLTPAASGAVERVATEVSQAAAHLSARRHGALIVFERETGLEDTAEAGVMLHADLSAELIETIFMPRSALHDGAIIVRGDHVLAAGAVLELSEAAVQAERFGTRHRAALSITESTDAVAVVVSEETGTISLVERARFVRGLDEERLRLALIELLSPSGGHGRGPFFLPAPSSLSRPSRLGWPRRRSSGRPVRSAKDDGPSQPAAAVPGAERR
ncbi:MAG TPA: diadenylate cyclase CdaA [Candidatus Limnocylindrales bacterium]|nr:diadenylate cyclase CdaA [Candidatus Limnocylindrales bacterium]